VPCVAVDVIHLGCGLDPAGFVAEPAQGLIGQRSSAHLAPSRIVAAGVGRAAFAIELLRRAQARDTMDGRRYWHVA
jgi:hypothetical protein